MLFGDNRSRSLTNALNNDYKQIITILMITSVSFLTVVVLCASPDSVRKIMIKAADLHFDNGEYVFFNIDLFSR